MKKTILLMLCLILAIASTHAQGEATSLGSKIGMNIKDALEVFIPGSQIIETLLTKVTGKENPEGTDKIKLTVDELKEKIKSANDLVVEKANRKIRPVKTFSDQAAFLSKNYRIALESRRSYTDALIYLITDPSSPSLVAAIKNGQNKAKELAKIKVDEANEKYTFDNGTFLALSKVVKVANDNSGNIDEILKQDYKTNPKFKNLLVNHIAIILNNGFMDIELLTSKIGLDLIKEIKNIEIADELIASIDELNMFYKANSEETTSSIKYMSTSFLNNMISTSSDEEIKKYFQEFDNTKELQKVIFQRSE